MTVASSTNKVSYSGNGSTVTFPYTFKIFADGDLTVIIRAADGTETTQTLTTHYSVTGAGDEAGGNVVMVTAPASGETLVIKRELDILQETDYPENDPFPAESHEDALDRLTMIAQQLQEQMDRAFTYPETYEGGGSKEMPEPSASMVLAWNSTGDALENVTGISATAIVSAFGETLIDDADAAAVLATLGLDADLATLSLPASTTISAFGKTLIDDADAAAARTTLGISNKVVQMVHNSVSAVVSGSTQLPLDDTIPQQTEGFEVITLSITPTNASNILLIIASIAGVRFIDSGGGAALFQDSTANALAAVVGAGGSLDMNIQLIHKMTAGTTSETTFKIRIGENDPGTVYCNVVPGATGRVFGGVSGTTLTILEMTP